MKMYHSLRDVEKIPSGNVVTVGVFDGVHKGHIHIVKALVKRAKDLGAKSLILTFYPHPASVLYHKKAAPLLVSLKHRIRLLDEVGVNIVVLARFTKAFAKMKPENFVKDILLKKLSMKELLVGDNFVFGHAGSGDIRLLKEFARKYDFRLKRITLLKTKHNRVISSTHIRNLITEGRFKEVAGLLGRPVSILGTVKRGTRRGRILGYPTANIDPHHEAIPPSGVYAVYVNLDNKRYKGILNIGFRPTFHPMRYALSAIRYPPESTIEVHILNFHRNIYGKNLELIFVKRLRPEKRFKDKEGLIRRIRIDERAARRVFRGGNKGLEGEIRG